MVTDAAVTEHIVSIPDGKEGEIMKVLWEAMGRPQISDLKTSVISNDKVITSYNSFIEGVRVFDANGNQIAFVRPSDLMGPKELNNWYHDALVKSDGQIGAWSKDQFGYDIDPGHTSEATKQQNIKVAFATVNILGGVLTFGIGTSVISGTITGVSMTLSVDDLTTGQDGSTLLDNLAERVGIDKSKIDQLKFAVDVVSLGQGGFSFIKNNGGIQKVATWTDEQKIDFINIVISESTFMNDLDDATK